MTQNKTQQTDLPVADFIAQVDHPTRRADPHVLDNMFRRITGYTPKMWGPTIIGYGQYHYIYACGHEGDSLATGFSPRKAALSIYVLPGYQDFSEIISRLGKHKIGKSCIYINKLDDINLKVLEELIGAGLADLATRWPVTAT
tara:strand:+ start:990 stop:1418 length:429 start_codon:yes stop_codon:yes gene_type:complete